MRSFAVLVLAAALLVPRTGFSQASGPPADSRVVAQQAKAAFDAGDFPTAARLLEQAYRLKPWPVYLYNLGRTYQQAGNSEQAVAAYERYLEAEPRSADAGAVRESIRQLKERLERDRQLEDAAQAARERFERESTERKHAQEQMELARLEALKASTRGRRKASPLPWVTVGVGLGGVAAGAVFGALATSAHGAAVSDASVTQSQLDQSSARRLALIANTLFVVGGAVAVVGTVWGIFDLRVALSPAGPRGAVLPGSLVLGGRF